MRQGDSPATFFRDLFSRCRVLSAAAAAVLSQQLAASTAPRAQPDSLATSASDGAAADLASQWELARESGTAGPVGESGRQQEAGRDGAAGEQLIALGLSFELESEGSAASEQEKAIQQEEAQQSQQTSCCDGNPDADAPDSDAAPAAGSVIDVQPQPSSSLGGNSAYGNSGGDSSSSSSGNSAGHSHNSTITVGESGQPAAAAALKAVAATLQPGAPCRLCTAHTHQGMIGTPRHAGPAVQRQTCPARLQ